MRFFGRRPRFVRPDLFRFGGTVIVCGVLSSCGPDFSSKSKLTHTPTIKKDLGNNKIAAVTAEIIGLEPFRYQVDLRWSEETTNVSIFINKQFAFKAESPSVTSYSVGVDHNQEYIITVYSQKDAQSQPFAVSEMTLNTPLDVVLSSDFIKSAPMVENTISIQAHRVFLLNSIVTEGKNILLNTDELIADQAELMTFKDTQKAVVDTVGRSGGTIFIKSQRAKGNIIFVLRGENGGDGSNGVPYTERALRGPKGKDGYLVTCDAEERRCKTTCSPWPENGYPGLPGNNGNAGGNGRYGGNTGSLRLEIAEVSPNFYFKIEKVIGTAGTPGSGGPGQLGGPGGFPGKFSEYCKAAIGPEGPTGPKGANGIREANGVIENDCVSIGDGFGRCS